MFEKMFNYIYWLGKNISDETLIPLNIYIT